MTKKHFIELADFIRANNWRYNYTTHQIEGLAEFLQSQNSRFNRERWLSYIAGECGPNGGRVKHESQV